MHSDFGSSPRQHTNKKIELLAPAGGYEALKAAVENGADAVYLGGKMFNARASASNFDSEELLKAVTYAHERGVKVYVTLNILVADSEFSELADYVYQLYSLGADALIVQDIGVANFIRKVLPEMKLHASTQMTQNNIYGLKQLEKMGFSRVVLARETSAPEIEKIVQATELDVEVFGHGALCISYSGQCLMSSYIGGRSGNRGRCAQPCRMAYSLVDGKGRDLLEGRKTGEHLLSPRDLKLLDNLGELQRIGVRSLKIEGRMKRPEYVATVIRVYRKALDFLQDQKGQEITARDLYELTQIFNRDFTTGYFQGYQGAEMMSFSRPNNRGTMLGRITDLKNNRLTLKLDRELGLGDGLEIWTKRGREGISVGKIMVPGGKTVECAAPGDTVTIEFEGAANIGDRVFKTHDEGLIAQARLSFQEGKEMRKRPLKMQLSGKAGQKLRLTVWDDQQHVALESQCEAQEAQNRPLTQEVLVKQLGRLGNTPFYLGELTTALEGDLMIPVSALNELRRAAVEKLLEPSHSKPALTFNAYQERTHAWNQQLKAGRTVSGKTGAGKHWLSAAVTDSSMIAPLLKSGADRIILGGEHWRSRPPLTLAELQKALDTCQSRGRTLLWRLPRILNQTQCEQVLKDLTKVAGWSARPVIMAGNLAEIEMVKTVDPEWTWETDYFMHCFNEAALEWVRRAGGRQAALSMELSQEQLAVLGKSEGIELLVFGDMEMMVSEFCLPGAVMGEGKDGARNKCGKACQNKDLYLKDRMAYHFPLAADQECRMHVFNAKTLNLVTELSKIADMGIRNIRLELLRASLPQAERAVAVFHRLWQETAGGKNIGKEETEEAMKSLEGLYPDGFTRGHFYRGVLT
ncbi:MAG: DUF3656 domain-containing protein [Dehalobacter sp.]|nr:DUF3656 domain-containing protein [Dehalobacter sp.]